MFSAKYGLKDVSRFTYKSIRLHWGRFSYTTKSFCLHGLCRFANIEVVSSSFISRNILWRWMNITACRLQLAEESNLTVLPVKFRDITAFDWGGERLLVRVTGRFQKWGFHPLICSLRPVRLLWWKGGRKENHTTTVICKQTNLIVQHGTRFASPRNVFPRLDSISIHVFGWIHHLW